MSVEDEIKEIYEKIKPVAPESSMKKPTDYTGVMMPAEEPPMHGDPVIVYCEHGRPSFSTWNDKLKTYVTQAGHEIVWPTTWTEIPLVTS
jgi:hypothetical protein